MPEFFKRLSTFRLLIIWLLILSAGFQIHAWATRRGTSWWDSESGRKVYSALLECTDEAAEILAGQEFLALSLAARLEPLPVPYARDAVEDRVKKVLAQAPPGVSEMGAAVGGGGGKTEPLVHLFRIGESNRVEAVPVPVFLPGGYGRPANAAGRRFSWRLLEENGTARASLLAVPIGSPARGWSLLKADLDWLLPLLERLAVADEVMAVCITPARDILWPEGGRLLSGGKNAPDPDSFAGKILEQARRAADGPTPLADRDSFIADIGGTGWRLLAARPELTSRFFTLQAFLLAVAGAAFIFETGISRIMGKEGKANGDAPPGKRNLWLGRLGSALFQYRILNPQRERLESELRVAREIQFSLVPETFPGYSEWREFDLHARLVPAREVGGDYYDFFMLDSTRFVLSVGDVSGKGVPAALYMAVCRTAFRTLARGAKDPGRLLNQLNNLLVRDNKSGLYVTIACFMVDLSSGDCQYSLAGHPAPLLRSARTGKSGYVDAPRDTVVGLKAGVRYPVGNLRLDRGDTLLLYTDGVSEARNPAGDELDYPELLNLFARCAGADSCRDVVTLMENELRTYANGRAWEDDITLQAFRYWGAGGRRMPLSVDAGLLGTKRDGNG